MFLNVRSNLTIVNSRLAPLAILAFSVGLLLAPAFVQADASPSAMVPLHVTLRGPGTIVDLNQNGAVVCSAPQGTATTHVTVCDGTAKALALTSAPPNYSNFQVALYAHGPMVNGTYDDAGWRPSSWAGACSGTSAECAYPDGCATAGTSPTCLTPTSPSSSAVRAEPVMSGFDTIAPAPPAVAPATATGERAAALKKCKKKHGAKRKKCKKKANLLPI